MGRFQIVMLWLAIYSVRYGTCSVELPHPGCSYDIAFSIDNVTHRLLRCADDLDMPNSFNVDLIPSNVTMIALQCPPEPELHCNMMRGDVHPLPYRDELVNIALAGFRTDNAQHGQSTRARIPVPQFLSNVRHRIKILQIAFSKIGYLDGEFLRGFQSLEILHLFRNDISSIDVDSFRFLMDPLVPVPSAAHGLQIPKLSFVLLPNNHLRDFDWAVFEPVARTVSVVDISAQDPGLTSLHHTGQPFSMTIAGLRLRWNKIREIPAAVLDTVALGSGGFLDAEMNSLCLSLPSGSGDCSCCEMVNLMKWIERNTKNDSLWSARNVYFSCGSGPVFNDLTQNSTFPLAMFAKCPEADTTVTFPNRLCYAPQPLRIECSLGRFELRNSTRETTDASTVIFTSDGRRQCVNILYELHNNVLEMAGTSTARIESNEAVLATCKNGTLQVNEEDPDASFANKIIFQSDSSLSCHEQLHRFLGFVYALPQNNPGNSESSPMLPIDDWLSDFLVCADAEPLVVNCTSGVMTSSEKNLTQSPAITLLFYTDSSFDCRVVWKSVHEHILQQELVQIDSYAHAEREDAVVAVVQHGVTVISENQPNKSTKRNLKYYSASNRLSQNKFRKLTGFLQSRFGNSMV